MQKKGSKKFYPVRETIFSKILRLLKRNQKLKDLGVWNETQR
jgi:hypothetical protein